MTPVEKREKYFKENPEVYAMYEDIKVLNNAGGGGGNS